METSTPATTSEPPPTTSTPAGETSEPVERKPRVGRRRPEPVSQGPRPVKLWSWPKIVFFLPVMVAAFICALGATIWPDRGATWGTIFFIVFFVNTIIMGFDFPRASSLNLVMAAIVIFLAGFLINQQIYTFWDGLKNLMNRIQPVANNQFYLLVGLVLAVVYLIVWLIDVRFNYWLIYPNEIVHRHGLVGKVDSYPTTGLEIRKEITDVFEHAMLRSGRLIIQPETGQPIVLDTVTNVDRKQEQIQRLLGGVSVEVEAGDAVRQVREPAEQ